jgi:2-polyprenyl-3-methyl-5-hydroxy-6-metoxy-1,4-benzoquinol methylase
VKEIPPPLRNQKLNWLRYLFGIKQSFRSGNATFREVDCLPLSTALYGRRPRGHKDYEVTFDDGHTMLIRQTREQSYSDVRGRTEIYHYERIADRLKPGMVMLDAACGTGYGTDWLASHGPQAQGLDLSEKAVEYATHRYPHLKFTVGSVLELPFPDNTFDAITSVETIEHVPGAEKMVSEMHRVLKPGGWWYVTTPVHGHCMSPYHVKEYTQAEFAELLGAKFGAEKGWEWLVNDGHWMEVVVRKA